MTEGLCVVVWRDGAMGAVGLGIGDEVAPADMHGYALLGVENGLLGGPVLFV